MTAHQIFRTLRRWAPLAVLVTIGIIFLVELPRLIATYTGYASVIEFFLIATWAWVVYIANDRIFDTDFNRKTELQDGNVAYAIDRLGFSIILAAVVLASYGGGF